jgi:hypothetical protein
MRATLLLADHAVVAEGKLYVNGGGWSVTSPGAPSAIAIKLDVPWDRTERPLELRLRLIGQDGEPVVLSGPDGMTQPVEIRADAQVGRPSGLAEGGDVDFPLAFQIGPLPLEPGQRYQWVLEIDGESREDWRLTFSTRPAQAGPATYVVDQ